VVAARLCAEPLVPGVAPAAFPARRAPRAPTTAALRPSSEVSLLGQSARARASRLRLQQTQQVLPFRGSLRKNPSRPSQLRLPRPSRRARLSLHGSTNHLSPCRAASFAHIEGGGDYRARGVIRGRDMMPRRALRRRQPDRRSEIFTPTAASSSIRPTRAHWCCSSSPCRPHGAWVGFRGLFLLFLDARWSSPTNSNADASARSGGAPRQLSRPPAREVGRASQLRDAWAAARVSLRRLCAGL